MQVKTKKITLASVLFSATSCLPVRLFFILLPARHLLLLLLASGMVGGLPTVSLSQTISTIAGDGTAAYGGDGGAATSAQLNFPTGVCIDASGNVYVADMINQRIRKVTVSTGIITTIAGDGTTAYGGDGGAATSAQLNGPNGICLDASGNVYFTEYLNHTVRKVTVSTGIITTIAGNGTGGYSGDGGAAISAQLRQPWGVSIDASGNVYIADALNNVIRKVTVSTGIITTIAGTGTAGYSGDGGAATSAQLGQPFGVAVDVSGNVYISDKSNNRIRKVTTSTGIITTIAGDGTATYGGDGGAATSAQLNSPSGVFYDASGNVYIADRFNNRIRKVTVSTGIITTIAGDGTAAYGGDGGAATSAQLNSIMGVFVDAGCELYIADRNNHRVRKVIDISGPPCGPVPVEWLYFNACRDGSAMRVRCDWSTATELNNDYFAIERAVGQGSNLSYEQIGTMKGAGNSSTVRNYVYYDYEPYMGLSYYRLRQVDYNGAYEYSPIRAVYIGTLEIINIYPNPASEFIHYTIGSEEGGNVTVKLYDVMGREVISETERIERGITEKKLSTSALCSGAYMLKIVLGKHEKTQKQFLIKKE